MITIDKLIYWYLWVQVAIYVSSALLFLIDRLNPIQRHLTKLVRAPQVYFYVQCVYATFCIGIIFAWFQFERSIGETNRHLENHLDKTTLDYIEEKEVLYKNERNLYLYGAAFFVSLANLRYLGHIHEHYEVQDKVAALQKQIKKN